MNFASLFLKSKTGNNCLFQPGDQSENPVNGIMCIPGTIESSGGIHPCVFYEIPSEISSPDLAGISPRVHSGVFFTVPSGVPQ